jgi:hypothetical protein
MEEIENKGYIFVPYICKTISTSINNETVWYSNKWKNLFLRIKFFFIKPKCYKNSRYYKKTISTTSFYKDINN